jgi:type IV pilus assembly protein PilE
MKPATAAFTLLELIIALAIVAVLAAFAVPSYRSYVMRAHRTDAASALYRAAQFVEANLRTGEPATLPAGLDQAPSSGTPVYRLRVVPADEVNGGYALEATPSDAGPMRDDSCGTYALDATGARTNRAIGSGVLLVDSGSCWNARS